MTSFAQITPLVLGSGTQLDYATLKAKGVTIPEFEQPATPQGAADWCFDLGDETNLVDRTLGKVLTPAASSPIHEAGYLTIQAGSPNGLKTPFDDEIGSTYWGVVKRPTNPTVAALIASTATNASDMVNVGGQFLYFASTGNVVLNVRGYAGSVTAVSASAVGVGSWCFFAVAAESTGGGTSQHRVFVGAPTPIVAVGNGTKITASPQRKLSIGNAYTTTTNYSERALDFQRFGRTNRVMTVMEITSLYHRCKVVAARRGITVV